MARTQMRWTRLPYKGGLTVGATAGAYITFPKGCDRLIIWSSADGLFSWNTGTTPPTSVPAPATSPGTVTAGGQRKFIADIPQIIEVEGGAASFGFYNSTGGSIDLRFEAGESAGPSA